MKFVDVYLMILKRGISSQADTGAMLPGHNGHYHDPETPVRNTSHYLIAFLRAWQLSGDPQFRDAAERCLNWLIRENPHRMAHTFHHRTKPGKDKCNGLIGPAWNMEALLFAAKHLEREDAFVLARDLFLMHPFDSKNGIWQRIEPDGETLSIDPTFNHQLWFAACGAPLSKESTEAKHQIDTFISMLDQNWKVACNGRIIHPLWLPKRRMRECVKRCIKPSFRKEMISKEIGYQTFNLYAFALLKSAGVTLPTKEQHRVSQALNYLSKKQYKNGIISSACGFPYNPPGWEAPYAISLLGNQNDEICSEWFRRQLTHSYDPASNMLSRNTSDPETHTARIYEVARLSDDLLHLSISI